MKRFKLNKLKRFIILGVTLFATILTIVLGSTLYIKDNIKKGIEYGGGAEYVVNINANSDETRDPTDEEVETAKKISVDVAESIYDRIDGLGVEGATVEPEINKDGASVRISYPGLTTADEVKSLEDLIISKPHLIFTDFYGNVLFNDAGNFRTVLRGDPGGIDGDAPGSNGYKNLVASSLVPIKNGGAKTIFVNGQYQVQIELESNKISAWTQATSYVSRLPQNQIIAWLDLNKLIDLAENAFPTEWANANKDPYTFVHVSEKVGNILKKHQFDASKYMISAAAVRGPLSGATFVIEGKSFTLAKTNSLAQKISYGISNYQLEIISSIYVGASYGSNAFNKAMIAGLIVFALIAVFLIANYGLLGALSTVSIALYMFLTLMMFTVMKGEYSPETIAALIIGVGMSVDANIITFERLKTEVYRGNSINKANKLANKQSFSTIFDANITTLIVAFVLFFFGTRSIVGLSVMLILSIFFTLLIMLLFTRMLSTLLINTKIFDDKKHLLGANPKFDNKVQKIINKPDYVKSAKWFSYGSGGIIVAAVAIFTGFAAYAGSLTGGFNMSQEFTGGTALSIESETKGRMLSPIDVINIKEALVKEGKVATSDIQTIYDVGHEGDANYITQIRVKTTKEVDTTALIKHYKGNPILKLYSSTTTSDVAKQLVKDAMFAILIAMALIVVYTLIRFKWTYSFAAIVALVHDGLIVTAVFVITRVEISPVFIAGVLSVIGYSINDTIVTFDRVREKMNESVGELTPKKIKQLANDAIKDTLKRSILTSLTTVTAVLILMSFGNATKFTFNLALLIGLIAGTYSSIFIASFFWVKLETFRQKKIKARANNNFWTTPGVEEQTFEGINNFRA